MIKKIKGTNDIIPAQFTDDIFAVEKWQFIENVIRECTLVYGYSEIRTPVFENTELFIHGLGDITDIVTKEMFTFEDRGERSLTLRPEGTASVVRSLLENSLHRKQQINRLFYIGPMFRAERPQKGRYRQFHQCGVENIGDSSTQADIEVIALFWTILHKLGLNNIELVINSVGCPVCRPVYNRVLKEFFADKLEHLCSDCNERYEKNILRMLDCKNEKCQHILNDAPDIQGSLCDDCSGAYHRIKQQLTAIDIPFATSSRLVRGLDYYTQTAFEFIHNGIGAQATVAGGGRYDGLVESTGGPSLPAVGAAFGIERLLLAMEAEEINIPEPAAPVFYLVIFDSDFEEEALRLCYQMRSKESYVELGAAGRAVGKQLKSASKSGAHYAVFIGGEEWQDGYVLIKDLVETKQYKISREGVTSEILLNWFENKK